MNYRNPERADALAAQYVLGTMRGRARARFVRLVRSERGLADAVLAWEERLMPFAHSWPVESAAGLANPARHPGRAAPKLGSMGDRAWRGLTLAGFVTALAQPSWCCRRSPSAPTRRWSPCCRTGRQAGADRPVDRTGPLPCASNR
jgi:hypothetical protein